MWELVNNTPFAAERAFVRDREGGEVLIVVTSGTFIVRSDGTLRCSVDPVAPPRLPAFAGAPGASSLNEDGEFVLTKPATDVIVSGHAYAPDGRPAAQVEVAVQVGAMRKSFRVHGERVWMQSLGGASCVPGPAQPFDRVRLSYERSFGGTDPTAPAGKPRSSASNPIGVGFSYTPGALAGTRAHQLDIGDVAAKAGPFDLPAAGFGAIAASWSPRLQFAGTYDEGWKQRRAPLLPADFDERFFCSAPADQRLSPHAQGAEPIALLNLTPEGRLTTRLPRIRVLVRAVFRDREERALSRLHTVHIEPDERRVRLIWHAAVPCHGREDRLRRVIVDRDGDAVERET